MGIKCVAAPVFAEGQVAAALGMSVPKERFEQTAHDLTRTLAPIARELSAALQDSLINLIN